MQRSWLAGYETRGYIANRFLIRDLGFSRGFEEWQYMTDEELPPTVMQDFEMADVEESHFFYVHFFGPHQPLRPTAARIQKYAIDETIFREKGLGFRFMKESEENIQSISPYTTLSSKIQMQEWDWLSTPFWSVFQKVGS